MVEEAKVVILNLGEWWVGNSRETVVAMHGLGSCLGVTLYDPLTKLGAAAHVVLPNARSGQEEEAPAKFADTVLPFLLSQLEEYHCQKHRLVLKAVGGANVLRFPRPETVLSIGTRNEDTLRKAAKDLDLTIRAADLGGGHGRSMRFSLEDGKILVSGFGREGLIL